MLIEATQDITVEAWDKVYGKRGYEDSRIVLGLFRQWAEEFEKWWQSDVVAQEEDDYMSAIDKFTERKVSELIRELGLPEKKEYLLTRLQQQVIIDALRDRIGKLYDIAERYTDNTDAKKDCYDEARIVKQVLDEFLAM